MLLIPAKPKKFPKPMLSLAFERPDRKNKTEEEDSTEQPNIILKTSQITTSTLINSAE